jgi:arylformamidase
MVVYDVTLSVYAGMPVWPGDPDVKLDRVKKIEEGANSNVSYLAAGVHTGTHVDAPVHFLPGGATIDQLDLEVLVGEAQVVVLPDQVDVIDSAAINQAGIESGTQRLIFKTRNTHYWEKHVVGFQTDFVGINVEGARELVKMGVKLVGIDYLSISPYKRSRPTHEVLLGSGMIVVEGLDLSRVPAGRYRLYCLPLKLKGSDGSPARVILVG